MRPVDYTEQPVDARAQRKQLWWRVFFGCLMLAQITALLALEIGFWWVVLASSAAVGLFEAAWFAIDRRRSDKARRA